MKEVANMNMRSPHPRLSRADLKFFGALGWLAALAAVLVLVASVAVV